MNTKTQEETKLTMAITMNNTGIKEMPAVLRLIAKNIEHGIHRVSDEKFSYETTLSPTHLVHKF